MEAAHGVLRSLAPEAVSTAARSLLRFDRRGLASSAARRQVVAVLRREPSLREQVEAVLLERPEIAASLAAWREDGGTSTVRSAQQRGDIDLLVAALWASGDAGASFSLGLCVGAAADAEIDAEHVAEVAGVRHELDAANVARERIEQRLAQQSDALEGAQEQLRIERSSRRSREQSSDAEVASARRSLAASEEQLAQLRAGELVNQQNRARDSARIADVEGQLQHSRQEKISLQRAIATPAVTPEELHDLAAIAQSIGAKLNALGEKVAAAPKASTPTRAVPLASQTAGAAPRPAAPTRRTRVNLPGGLSADTADGARAIFTRTADLVVIVDGYNVSKRAWPESPLSDQREKLARALHQVHMKFGCDIVCCFDGDGTEGVRPIRRAGLRIAFSSRGQEADELVVDEVESLPKRIPVVIASSDAWVREHAERAGATVIASPTLLELARLAGRR